jgi:HEAT repeat protein
MSYLMFFDDSKKLRELKILAASLSDERQPLQSAVTTVAEPAQGDLEIWILEQLASPEQSDRIVAVRKLTELGADVALDLASSLLVSEQDPEVRGEVVAVFGKIGGDRISPLLESAMADADASVRKRAIQVWRTLDSQRAIPVFGRVLSEDPDTGARLMALQALIAIDDDAARIYVELARSDQDESIRQMANRALEAAANTLFDQAGDSDGGSGLSGTRQAE